MKITQKKVVDLKNLHFNNLNKEDRIVCREDKR